MRCNISKDQHPNQSAFGNKSWEFSVEINSYSKTRTSATSRQCGEPEVNWILGRIPELSNRRIRSCRRSHYRAFPIRQDAPTPEEFKKPGPIGERHVWAICVTTSEGTRVKRFGSSLEIQIDALTQHATEARPEIANPTWHNLKKPGHYPAQCRELMRENDQTEGTKSRAGNSNTGQTNSNHNNIKNANFGNTVETKNQNDRKPRIIFPLCETCAESKHSTAESYFGSNAAIILPPRHGRPTGQIETQRQDTLNNAKESFHTAAPTLFLKRQVSTPVLYLTD